MNYKTNYTADTHILIWYLEGHPALSKKAKETMDEALRSNLLISLSPISFLEAFHNSLKRPGFNFIKFQDGLRLPNILVVPVEEELLEICYRLPANLDLHDRVIAATAKITRSVLITKDRILRKVPGLKTLW